MQSLFYVRLIGFTAGTLVYLFLLALILGHRRPRTLERLIFFVCLSFFLIYAGALLYANGDLYYSSAPFATRLFSWGLVALGLTFLPGLLVHTHAHYLYPTMQGRSIPKVLIAVICAFYVVPVALSVRILHSAVAGGLGMDDRFAAFFSLESLALAGAVVLCCAADIAIKQRSQDATERSFFTALFVVGFASIAVVFFPALTGRMAEVRGESLAVAFIVVGIYPGALLLIYAVRRNFLEFGVQRNLMYALPVTFLAVLYLALVRRVGVWLEPVMPPEATAAVLLFSLIFLFEPLERVIGPILQERFRQGMSGVQRLSIELQQEARQGNVTRLISEAEGRIREEFGLAAVRITLRPNPALPALEAPGGLGHTATVRLKKDGEEIGLLEAASTGSYLTGETTAALGFLGEQLPGMIDLARLIEDKVRLERELAERERMASLGQMAANVSHNLRNPLSSMKTVLQVQLEDPDLPVNVRRDSTLVVSEIDRMSAKLTQLLRYAKPSVNGQRVAAVALANQTAVLFRHDAERRNVRFEFERPTEEIFALASEEALSEILSNLIVNAIEAQGTGGRVKVGLARTDGRLEIMVEDGGPGISPELREKMFQPYFTTKPAGTGLGLSIVARRVEEMGGTISCESPVRNGKGTRFRLTLPLATGEGS